SFSSLFPYTTLFRSCINTSRKLLSLSSVSIDMLLFLLGIDSIIWSSKLKFSSLHINKYSFFLFHLYPSRSFLSFDKYVYRLIRSHIFQEFNFFNVFVIIFFCSIAFFFLCFLFLYILFCFFYFIFYYFIFLYF